MSETKNETYQLCDSAIAQIAKILQGAILTGTDISDNLRQLELTESEESGKLTVSEGYQEIFNNNVEKMVEEAGKTAAPKMEQIRLFD